MVACKRSIWMTTNSWSPAGLVPVPQGPAPNYLDLPHFYRLALTKGMKGIK